MGLGVFGKACIGRKVYIVIRVIDSRRALDFERNHHQLDDVRWDYCGQCDAVVLLQNARPTQADVAVAMMRFAIDLAALLDG